jgi:hypothetical protein
MNPQGKIKFTDMESFKVTSYMIGMFIRPLARLL